MTTLRQVTRLVRPVLERHPDLVQVGRWLFLTPVHHIARAILVERISEAARFRLWWSVTHLCEPVRAFPLNWATMIYPTLQWQWENPLLQSLFEAAVEEQILPDFSRIDSLDAFYAHAMSGKPSFTRTKNLPMRKIFIDAACGKFDDARETCGLMRTWSITNADPDFLLDYERITQQLCPPLAAEDRPEIGRVLRSWEADTVSNLKITHLYEPTPFPFELQR